MENTDMRKAYERPTLVKIGSMEEKTETWGGFWRWKRHIASTLYGHYHPDSSHDDSVPEINPDS
ncbi:hypothetical protein HVA01_32440 [Halovibrio variabilis]|uniref:Lasso RiPP family leader peptide-containing protein n=1 Tax=Halovibrio variabilis TaxID=31910 RepID=A0A511UV51_9GAMM|nr:keywimysin-related RiPP [Halovibrio variabilis]GEN29598.1 hypothetical protein HVA01_32440 [Halovibrio variabilis]